MPLALSQDVEHELWALEETLGLGTEAGFREALRSQRSSTFSGGEPAEELHGPGVTSVVLDHFSNCAADRPSPMCHPIAQTIHVSMHRLCYNLMTSSYNLMDETWNMHGCFIFNVSFT